ncbi:MAG TPA: response regulator [Bryobacteraceae bacterium]
MTGLLLDTPLSGEQREYAEIVRTSSEALLAIINDILDFSKIEAGKLSLDAFPFDLRSILEEASEIVAPTANQKGVDLIVHYPTAAPTHLVGDGDRIRQVVTNLAGNAVKFTATGHVLLAAEFLPSRDPVTELRISVTDTGIGIPAHKLGTLFEKFTQADSCTTRKYGGTGLGLAISKRLVELMGGSIGVQSQEGKGSQFWFSLKLPQAEQPEVNPAPSGILRGLRALIVDDNEVNCRVVRDQISSYGIRSGSASAAGEALAELRAARASGDPYDFVISDFQMPGGDGAALAVTVHQDCATAGATRPVFLMLTSVPHWREQKGMEDASVDACLVKPVRQARLIETLATLWSLRRQSEPEPAVPPPQESSAASLGALQERTASEFDGCGARVLVVEDNAVNQKVAVMMLSKLGVRADVAGNGREGLEMLQMRSYDVVFMDCQMPEMNGYEATGYIRRLEGSGNRVPVVAMTATAIEGSRERCLEHGMDDFISKPVQIGELRRALAAWLQPAEVGRLKDT